MSSIKTAVRIRPFLASELEQHYKNTKFSLNLQKREIISKDQNNGHKKCFKFDYLLSQEDTQDGLYMRANIDEMVNKSLEGYHSTIFAYGQTGSGKTYTMEGEHSSQQEGGGLNGLIPKVTHKIFQKINKMKGIRTYTVSVSFLQIYSEKIYDLLNSTSLNNRSLLLTGVQNEGLRLRWSKDQQFTVENLFLFECKNEAELLKYFQAGLKNRISATHKLNLQSSRSHSILSIKLESFDNNDPSQLRSSRFQLVDLAGSERLSLTGTEGKLAKESIDINKSLFTLRQVINVLAENGNKKREEKVYVPYRDSKLTSILKQSIGGNSFCLMIACINPNDSFFDQNISTLTYATKASFITNTPILNDDPKLITIKQLRQQIKQISSELQKANKHIEFISTLNEQKFKEPQPKFKQVGLSQEKALLELQGSMPTPSFNKVSSDKNGKGWDSAISQRLIQSINMVRELLKSNKQLRQKLQNANRCVDESNIEISELFKEIEELKQRIGETPNEIQPIKPSTNNSKRFSFKIANNKPADEIKIEKVPKNHVQPINQGVSVQLNKVYMNEKGLDSVPTNFNKRLTSTSQQRRASFTRGNSVSEQDRYAITAKFSRRGWLGRDGQGNKFLSFYDDIRS